MKIFKYLFKSVLIILLMPTNIKRIVTDIKLFLDNKFDNISIYYDKLDVSTIYSMIVGPQNTPYQYGYYFFKITFPDNYPFSPPKVTHLTTDGKVRFNPNLYACGKVCLSILGTWSGPPWTTTMTLTTVLLSIQSLLNEYPLRNEPGYDNISVEDNRIQSYNVYVIYNNYKIAICDVVNNKFDNISKYFIDDIKKHFQKNYEFLKNDLLTYSELYGNYPLHHIVYGSQKTVVNFNTLLNEFIKIDNKN